MLLQLTKLDRYGVSTSPVTIRSESIRCFYPRRENAPGTRLTFTDGGGFAVAEPYAEVQRYIETGVRPEPREPLSIVAATAHDEEHDADPLDHSDE